MNRIWTGLFLLMLTVLLASAAFGFGMKKKRPKPHEYGNVLINNFSQQNNIEPVVFKHWLHRAKFTCRLCHVDIGFAMQAGETEITEADNRMGLYCGTCHNNKIAFGPDNPSPKGSESPNCEKCHSYGREVQFKYDFYIFKKGMPRDRFGNGIDWLKAEEQRLLTPQDYIEGVSIKRSKIKSPEEFDLKAKEPNMPDIVLSHQKHTVWNGCELCHPEIFGVKKGSKPYSMQEIFSGRYCGVCHDKVAFPNIDCQKCHTKPV